jgi:hypothetical protein
MGKLTTAVVSVTTTGGDGSATGSGATGGINGWLESIYLDFNASAPAGTTDTTVAYTTRGGNILVVTNSATDALFAPRIKPVDNANAAITNAHGRFAINDTITVSVAQSNALTACVVAYITYEAA